MKVVTLSIKGIETAKPVIAEHHTLGRYFRFEHGEYGRGRKLVFIPLNVRDFPVDKDYSWENENYSLQRRSSINILNKGIESDNTFLVLWSLNPGYRGSAQYSLVGDGEIIAEGYEAQGHAGRMGGAPCPVVLVTGPVVLKWKRTGRIYDTPGKWVAIFDGENWIVRPDDPAEEELEQMIKGQI